MKDDLRKALLGRRDALSPEERRRQSRAVAARLETFPPARSARVLAAYHPIGSEVDLLEFLRDASARGVLVALPRVAGPALLFHAWAPGEPLAAGALRIPEPAAGAPRVDPSRIELVLVPGVAFDRSGHRLGYGRGYYDRFLAAVARERRVGVAFDGQVAEALPHVPHDAPMGWVLTPYETIHCKAEAP